MVTAGIRSRRLRGPWAQNLTDASEEGDKKIKIWCVNIAGCQQEGRRLADNLLQGLIRETNLQISRSGGRALGAEWLSGDRDDNLEPAHKHRSSPEMPDAGSPPSLRIWKVLPKAGGAPAQGTGSCRRAPRGVSPEGVPTSPGKHSIPWPPQE